MQIYSGTIQTYLKLDRDVDKPGEKTFQGFEIARPETETSEKDKDDD